MVHVQQFYGNNHLQTSIRILRSSPSSNFWHEKAGKTHLAVVKVKLLKAVALPSIPKAPSSFF